MPPNKIKALSPLEEEFAQQLLSYGIEAVRNYKFHPTRKWEFDFAILDLKIAVEIQGGTRRGGGHTTHAGVTRDCRKGNAAILHGWKLLHGTSEQVHDLSLIDDLLSLLHSSRNIRKNVTGDKP